MTAGIESALRSGTCSPDVVAVEAAARRRRGRPGGGAAGAGPRRSRAVVVTLPRRAGPLRDPRPLLDVAAYDQLLRLAPQPEEGSAS